MTQVTIDLVYKKETHVMYALLYFLSCIWLFFFYFFASGLSSFVKIATLVGRTYEHSDWIFAYFLPKEKFIFFWIALT